MADTTTYTNGHGNRSAEEFRGLLLEAGVRCLVDVRAHPGSRRHPRFSRDALRGDLEAADIGYAWQGDALGGRRRARADSPHIAWRNDSFRAYADHMESDVFLQGIGRLMSLATERTTAVMCAERLPWQCHRYLIADFLVARGIAVLHLIGPGAARSHSLNPIARVENGRLIYDRTAQLGLGLGD